MTARAHRLPRAAVLVLAVLAIAAVGGGAYAAHALKGTKSTATHPPALWPASDLGDVARTAAAEDRKADAEADAYLAAHPRADLATYLAWAQSRIPAPPSGAAQRAELAYLHGLPARTPAGDTAARWMEKHGFKDVWKLYEKQYGQLTTKAQAKAGKTLLKRTLKVAKTQQAVAKDHFARLSPYLTDRTLNAINQGRFTGRKYSYPSKHAMMATAATTVLEHLDPLRTPEFERMLDEVLYSRLYARGHYPSDLAAGERYGRLIADYELRLPG